MLLFSFLILCFAITKMDVTASFSLSKDIFSTPGLPKLVLLDRDGVINEDQGSPGVIDPSKLCLTPHASEALGMLKRAGCRIVLVTNQSCVGKGLLSEDGLDKIHDKMQQMLLEGDEDAVLDRVYSCTSTREEKDPRMKPHPGMITEACSEFNVYSNKECQFIGDTMTDMQAAVAGGITFKILVETGYGYQLMGERSASRDGDVALVSMRNNREEIPSWFKGDIMNVDPKEEHIPQSVLPFFYAENLFTAVSWLINITGSEFTVQTDE